MTDIEAALSALDIPHDANLASRAPWRELFSEEGQRYYYADTASSETSWDAPLHFRVTEWLLDASAYGLDLRTAKAMYDAADAVMGEWRAAQWTPTAELLIKVLANVVECGNAVEKYRHLRISNSKFHDGVWCKPGGSEVMHAAGFRIVGDALVLRPDASLQALTCLLARLRRIAAKKGHSGDAEFFPLPSSRADGVNGSSPFLNTPGFRHQTVIHHCSVCDHPINDGSERLFTGSYDSPKGECRYECEQCESVSLCEGCWDRRQDGDASHDASHTFRMHHVRTQRDNASSSGGAAGSPWGMVNAGGSANRARERLRERYGF